MDVWQIGSQTEVNEENIYIEIRGLTLKLVLGAT